MQIISVHYKISKPVSNYKEIRAEAEAMKRFIVRGVFKGFYNKAFAIAHCQVSETPMAFFVVAPECIQERMFKDQVIINPVILEAKPFKDLTGKTIDRENVLIDDPNLVGVIRNKIEYNEPCLSFPFRKPKRVVRYDLIKVKYQIRGLLGLKTIETGLSGIASEIFQHEVGHLQGKNIYFESEPPVKWWELIGNPKSIGGTSLDDTT